MFGRRNTNQKYFFVAGIALSSIVGSLFAVDALEFVFTYLFLGINLSLILGLIYHRARGDERCVSYRNSASVSGSKEKPGDLCFSDHKHSLAV